VRENNQNPSSVRLLSKQRGALAFFLTRADAGPGPGPGPDRTVGAVAGDSRLDVDVR